MAAPRRPRPLTPAPPAPASARLGPVNPDVQSYIDRIAPGNRPLFDRVHRLVLAAFPDAGIALSYGMPTYRVGTRKLHVGVWQHGVSLYGWPKDRATAFLTRHPDLLSGKSTIRLPTQAAAAVTDAELTALIRASLEA